MKFKDLGLENEILEAISYMGYEDATPVQEITIPKILKGKDLIACAQTGTGKTAAFTLPILNALAERSENTTDTLILEPTRELAIQVDQAIQGYSYYVSVGSIAIYGGGDGITYAEQERALKNGRDIIVATPGRLLSHIAQGYVNFSHVKHLILDEADKMLDMGFMEDIEKIVKQLPTKRQTLLFSATMPPKIRYLARKILKNPDEINIAISKPAENVTQNVFLCFENQKFAAIKYILSQRENYDSIIIFTSAKTKVNEIVSTLRQAHIKAAGISSNLDQEQRENVLMEFKAKKTKVLVATDILSRGIDIKDINMVINFDAPKDAEDYVHRIGRTARANTKGEAVTLISPKDMQRMHRIEELIDMAVDKLKLPDELGQQPEWNLINNKKNSQQRNKRPCGKNEGRGHHAGGYNHNSRNKG